MEHRWSTAGTSVSCVATDVQVAGLLTGMRFGLTDAHGYR